MQWQHGCWHHCGPRWHRSSTSMCFPSLWQRGPRILTWLQTVVQTTNLQWPSVAAWVTEINPDLATVRLGVHAPTASGVCGDTLSLCYLSLKANQMSMINATAWNQIDCPWSLAAFEGLVWVRGPGATMSPVCNLCWYQKRCGGHDSCFGNDIDDCRCSDEKEGHGRLLWQSLPLLKPSPHPPTHQQRK